MDIGEGMRTRKKTNMKIFFKYKVKKTKGEEIKKGAHIDVVAICTSILLSLQVFNSLKTFRFFSSKEYYKCVKGLE
jgi:hypothetical protein